MSDNDHLLENIYLYVKDNLPNMLTSDDLEKYN